LITDNQGGFVCEQPVHVSINNYGHLISGNHLCLDMMSRISVYNTINLDNNKSSGHICQTCAPVRIRPGHPEAEKPIQPFGDQEEMVVVKLWVLFTPGAPRLFERGGATLRGGAGGVTPQTPACTTQQYPTLSHRNSPRTEISCLYLSPRPHCRSLPTRIPPAGAPMQR
jgi:hypothetical protein